MIIDIHEGNIATIKNPVFRTHAQVHSDNYQEFKHIVSRYQLPLRAGRIYKLNHAAEIIRRNNDHSKFLNQISPACLACRGEVECASLFIS